MEALGSIFVWFNSFNFEEHFHKYLYSERNFPEILHKSAILICKKSVLFVVLAWCNIGFSLLYHIISYQTQEDRGKQESSRSHQSPVCWPCKSTVKFARRLIGRRFQDRDLDVSTMYGDMDQRECEVGYHIIHTLILKSKMLATYAWVQKWVV